MLMRPPYCGFSTAQPILLSGLMKLSKLLSWGAPKEQGGKEQGGGTAVAAKSSGGSFWSLGKTKAPAEEPAAAPAPTMDGVARVDWIESGEPRHQALVEFSGGTARLRTEAGPAPYSGVWLTPRGGRPLAARLIDRQEEGSSVRLEVSLDCAETDLGGSGGVRLRAAGSDGSITAQMVRIAASETPGSIDVTTETAVDAGVLVLLEAQEYGSLGVVRDSRPQGDGFVLRVETVMQAQELRTAA